MSESWSDLSGWSECYPIADPSWAPEPNERLFCDDWWYELPEAYFSPPDTCQDDEVDGLATLLTSLSIDTSNKNHSSHSSKHERLSSDPPVTFTSLPKILIIEIIKYLDSKGLKSLRLSGDKGLVFESATGELFKTVVFDPTQSHKFRNIIRDATLAPLVHAIDYREPLWGLFSRDSDLTTGTGRQFHQTDEIAAKQIQSILAYYQNVVLSATSKGDFHLKLKNRTKLLRQACQTCGLRNNPCKCGITRPKPRPPPATALAQPHLHRIVRLRYGRPVWIADSDPETAQELNALYRRVLLNFVRSYDFPSKIESYPCVELTLIDAILRCPQLKAFVFNAWDHGIMTFLRSSHGNLKHAVEEDQYGVDIWGMVNRRSATTRTADGLTVWLAALTTVEGVWKNFEPRKRVPSIVRAHRVKSADLTAVDLQYQLSHYIDGYLGTRHVSLELAEAEVSNPIRNVLHTAILIETITIKGANTLLRRIDAVSGGVFPDDLGLDVCWKHLRKLHLERVSFGNFPPKVDTMMAVHLELAWERHAEMYGRLAYPKRDPLKTKAVVTDSVLYDRIRRCPKLRSLTLVNCSSRDVTWPEQFQLFAKDAEIYFNYLGVEDCWQGQNDAEYYNIPNEEFRDSLLSFINGNPPDAVMPSLPATAP